MLKIKLFKGFAVLVVLFSILSAGVGVHTITRSQIREAKSRVRLDLSSAWGVFNSKLTEVETIVRLVAGKQSVVDACGVGEWPDSTVSDIRLRLERVRTGFGLDFLDLLSPDGQVLVRASPPYGAGDYRVSDAAVASALKGESLACVAVLSDEDLGREGDGLAQRAFLEIEETPRARRSPKLEETRGMVMECAAPVRKGPNVIGVIYGGLLVNRNHALVDRIHDVVYRNELYRGVPFGTATIFLDDSRIATTVRLANGNRALGTRASKEVADRVLDNGAPWVGDAFVVRDWYLTAYEPIRDGLGRIVGMLYVGILKRPFEDDARNLTMRYVMVSSIALLAALALAFYMASRLAYPIHRLVEASNRMRDGDRGGPVTANHACWETARLIAAFNNMTETLAEREEKLRALNRSYMETLGFVSHELKNPLGTLLNYAYLLREGKLGALTEKQEKAARAIASGSARIAEMVRHYLNLSRIEQGHFQPQRTRVAVLDEIVAPLLDSAETEIREKQMRVENRVGRDIVLDADANMLREVFENLIGNAIKYGRAGGEILLEAAAGEAWTEFRVRNEGEGIPPDQMPLLFQKFVRLNERQPGRREKGTGLGLFITKHIVDAHGGRVWAESTPGEWACFRFTMPPYREGQTPGGATG